jgi:hypothetical protein
MAGQDGTDHVTLRVCSVDGTPLVFTFEFTGAEYYCTTCGGTEGIFGKRIPADAKMRRWHDELCEEYGRDYAARRGHTYLPPEVVGDEGVVVPSCTNCGATPDVGVHLVDGKPRAWRSKEKDGKKLYACSEACIPAGEMKMPW